MALVAAVPTAVLPGLPPGAAPPSLSSRAAAVLQDPESAAHLQRFLPLDPGQFENHYVISSPGGVPVCDLEDICCDGASSIVGLPMGRETVVVLTPAPDGVPVPWVMPLDQPTGSSLRRTGGPSSLGLMPAPSGTASGAGSVAGFPSYGAGGATPEPTSHSTSHSAPLLPLALGDDEALDAAAAADGGSGGGDADGLIVVGGGGGGSPTASRTHSYGTPRSPQRASFASQASPWGSRTTPTRGSDAGVRRQASTPPPAAPSAAHHAHSSRTAPHQHHPSHHHLTSSYGVSAHVHAVHAAVPPSLPAISDGGATVRSNHLQAAMAAASAAATAAAARDTRGRGSPLLRRDGGGGPAVRASVTGEGGLPPYSPPSHMRLRASAPEPMLDLLHRGGGGGGGTEGGGGGADGLPLRLDKDLEEFKLVEAARRRAQRVEAILAHSQQLHTVQAQLYLPHYQATVTHGSAVAAGATHGSAAAAAVAGAAGAPEATAAARAPDRSDLASESSTTSAAAVATLHAAGRKRREAGAKPHNVAQVLSSLEAPLDRPMSVDLDALLSDIGAALAADAAAGDPRPITFDDTFRVRTERYLATLCRLNPAAFEEVSAAQAEADHRSSVERAKLRLRQLHGEVAGEPLTSAGKPRNQYDKAMAMLQAHRPFFLPPVLSREAVERAPVPPLPGPGGAGAARGAAQPRPVWDVGQSLFRERKRGDSSSTWTGAAS
ncbi:hypothetical protein GPECTOR_104g74 [Gonium pectorale]|uniref:Uncharacterized protein n=1 Tax=Gonium pectorale TaxID=33097 RepID=A0A150FZR2_GONPE|nr:hypothetical protein GPECTOR_104g74 [Gonium pectorale]|eukprot:KXZ43068.1 hypothetical protein GPECTOR_104g74 [Gonium pectorale]